jgi:hypothetical protein
VIDTKELIEQARGYVAPEWGSAAPLIHKMADTIARLETEARQATERADFCHAATREAQAFASHYADEVFELRTKVARLEAERDAARQLCATAYQVAGAAGASVELLDNLSAAASGQPIPHDHGAGLPFVADTAAARRLSDDDIAELWNEHMLAGENPPRMGGYEHFARAIRAAMP